MLLVHAGNRPDDDDRRRARLPAAQLDHVAAALTAVLSSLRPSGVVSAGAAGADLLLLEAAEALGTPVHVVVPIAEDEFVRRSVADAGDEWVDRWHRVVRAARAHPDSRVVVEDRTPEGEWYLEANGLLLDVSRMLGEASGEPVVALTVRPPSGEQPPSATDDFAARALAAGLVLLSLDPRPAPSASGVPLTLVAPERENRGDANSPSCD